VARIHVLRHEKGHDPSSSRCWEGDGSKLSFRKFPDKVPKAAKLPSHFGIVKQENKDSNACNNHLGTIFSINFSKFQVLQVLLVFQFLWIFWLHATNPLQQNAVCQATIRISDLQQ